MTIFTTSNYLINLFIVTSFTLFLWPGVEINVFTYYTSQSRLIKIEIEIDWNKEKLPKLRVLLLMFIHITISPIRFFNRIFYDMNLLVMVRAEYFKKWFITQL